MPFLLTWRLMWRFLTNFRRSRSSFVFTLICWLGIAITVFVFFLVEAIVSGYQAHIQKTLVGFEAPLQLVAKNTKRHIEQGDVLQDLQRRSGIAFAKRDYREFYALLDISGLSHPIGIKVRELKTDPAQTLGDQPQFYWAPDFDINSFLRSSSAVLISKGLFEKLRIDTTEDEFVTLMHPFADLGPTGEFAPLTLPFAVAGQVTTGVHAIDEYYVFLGPEAFRAFADAAVMKSVWQVFPDQESKIPALQNLWNETMAEHPGFSKLTSWFEKNQILVKLMQLERVVVFTLFVLLFLIASINLTSLVHIFGMTHLQNLMILRAIGASSRDVRRVFWLFGFVLGGLGTVSGLGLGVGLVWYLQKYPFHLPDTYGFTELPVLFPWPIFYGLAFGVPVFAVLTSLLTSYKYARQSVMDVLRKV